MEQETEPGLHVRKIPSGFLEGRCKTENRYGVLKIVFVTYLHLIMAFFSSGWYHWSVIIRWKVKHLCFFFAKLPHQTLTAASHQMAREAGPSVRGDAPSVTWKVGLHEFQIPPLTFLCLWFRNNVCNSCLSIVSLKQRTPCFFIISRVPRHIRTYGLAYSLVNNFFRTFPLRLCYEISFGNSYYPFHLLLLPIHSASFEMAQPLTLSFSSSFLFQDELLYHSELLSLTATSPLHPVAEK